MEKQETVTIRYCDICGKRVTDEVNSPVTTTNYQSEFVYGVRNMVEEHTPCIDLCGYHSRMVGHLMVDVVKEALSFVHNEKKLKEIIERKDKWNNKWNKRS